MDRMKTFLLYLLGILGFMFLSYILENGLIENMYEKMSGDITPSTYNLSISDVSGKASNVNGIMQFELTNNSQEQSNHFIKIDLFSKQGLLATTKYVRVTDLAPGDSKTYQVKFKGQEIRNYKLTITNIAPDMTNIINVLGWEIDLSDVFGMDLTGVTIFGVKLADIFKWDNAKTAAGNAWSWWLRLLRAVPWWGYAIATGIVIWNLPTRFLFGLFPL